MCLSLASGLALPTIADAQSSSSPSSASSADLAPDRLSVEFYRWYLGELGRDKDPLHDELRRMQRYVAQPLLAQIDRQIRSPDGMEADYFLKAQDFLDGWQENVAATTQRVEGTKATVLVALGGVADEPYRLEVQLTRAPGGWKILRVARR